jgi:hypothetical protein
MERTVLLVGRDEAGRPPGRAKQPGRVGRSGSPFDCHLLSLPRVILSPCSAFVW